MTFIRRPPFLLLGICYRRIARMEKAANFPLAAFYTTGLQGLLRHYFRHGTILRL